MNEVQSNKHAWSQVSEDHYHAFKARYAHDTHHLSAVIVDELGDLTGKRILHLQCNTGADTIALAKLGSCACSRRRSGSPKRPVCATLG
jgi:hypothetical protein